MKTSKTYTKKFFKNFILKNNSVKTAFYTTVKNPRGECEKQWKVKGELRKVIIFSSKVINFEHFTQKSTITRLFIKVRIWLVQSSLLSTINSNPPFAYVISSIWYSLLPFWLFSFVIVSLHCFTSEIQELMFLSQTLTTSWDLIQFPVAYVGRPFHWWWLQTVSYFIFHDHWGNFASKSKGELI